MFNPVHIGQHDALYPPALPFYLTDRAPAGITTRGNLDILHGQGAGHRLPTVALFCSVQCSSAIILQTYALARALRDAGVTVISGFHSPMEKECLILLLRGRTRNEFVAALADALLIAYATPDGKTERFCRDVLAWGKPLLTLESSENAGLLTLGARPIQPERLGEQWGITE